MQEDQAQAQAYQLVTAVLNGDDDLAHEILDETRDLESLVWRLTALAAGIWEHHQKMLDRDPVEAWRQSLLAVNRRS